MALKINASSLFTQRILKMRKGGIAFSNGSFGGSRKFRFEQIECVLLSPENVLSFQVGQEIFSIPVKPGKAKHEETLAAFLAALEHSRASAFAQA
jgi:hypothetical protein